MAMRWLWIPALVAVFFAGDRLAGYLLSRAVEASEFRYSRLYTDRAEADVLLVGNSRGLTYYQPALERLTNRSTFNLSYNGLPIEVASALAQDYLDRYGAPAVMLADVTMLDLDNPALTQDFRVYTPYSQRLDGLLRDSFPNIWGGTRLSHLSRFGGEVAQRAFYYIGRTDETWLLDRIMPEGVAAAAAEFEPLDNGYTPERVALFAEMVRRFREAGTEVYLTINPYYPAYAKTIGKLDALMADVEAATGLEVHDYSQAIESRELFGDYQHLNKAGAEVFLAGLVEELGLGGVN